MLRVGLSRGVGAWLIAAMTVTACSSSGSRGGGKEAHGAGKNVISAATIYARDLSNGKLVWTARPPAAEIGRLTVTHGRLRAVGNQSQRQCEFDIVTMSISPNTAAISGVHVQHSIVNPLQTPDIVEDGVHVTYYPPQPPNTPLPTAKRGPGFPATAPVDPNNPGLDDPNEHTGMIGLTAAGRMLWADLVPGERGPFPLDPPAHAYGVVAANFGGGNPYSGGGKATLVFLDARTGRLLWSLPLPSTDGAKIVGHRAYVVTADALQARNLRTGAVIWAVPARADVFATTDQTEVIWTLDGHIQAFDPAGHRIWSVSQPRTGGYSLRLAAGDDRVFVATRGRYATKCEE